MWLISSFCYQNAKERIFARKTQKYNILDAKIPPPNFRRRDFLGICYKYSDNQPKKKII